MLSAQYLDDLPESVVEIFSQAEMVILEDMARRISRLGKVSGTTQWQYDRLKEIGGSYEFIMQTLQSYLGLSQGELRQLFMDAGMETISYDDRIYRHAGFDPKPLSQSPRLLALIEAGMKKTNGLFRNLTNTTASAGQAQFIRLLDRAHIQVTSGAFSAEEAIRQAVKEVSREGLEAIHYDSGHKDHLDVAVRRATLTGANQTALKIQETRMEEFDCDLVETTAHAGARPSHSVWQGKVFSKSGKHPRYGDFVKNTRYGSGDGLGGWNCRHGINPFFEGISKSAYPGNTLKQLDSATVKLDGKQIPLYQATQQQRYIERQIRRWKREAFLTSGPDKAKAEAKKKDWQARQRDFIKQTGLRRDYTRERAGKQYA